MGCTSKRCKQVNWTIPWWKSCPQLHSIRRFEIWFRNSGLFLIIVIYIYIGLSPHKLFALVTCLEWILWVSWYVQYSMAWKILDTCECQSQNQMVYRADKRGCETSCSFYWGCNQPHWILRAGLKENAACCKKHHTLQRSSIDRKDI